MWDEMGWDGMGLSGMGWGGVGEVMRGGTDYEVEWECRWEWG